MTKPKKKTITTKKAEKEPSTKPKKRPRTRPETKLDTWWEVSKGKSPKKMDGYTIWEPFGVINEEVMWKSRRVSMEERYGENWRVQTCRFCEKKVTRIVVEESQTDAICKNELCENYKVLVIDGRRVN